VSNEYGLAPIELESICKVILAVLVVMIMWILGAKLLDATQRRCRGKALDFFQGRSWEELREQLGKLGLISTTGSDYHLDISLAMVGFGPSARAFGSWLTKRLDEAPSIGKDRREILSLVIDEVVTRMNGSERKTICFFGIAAQRYRLRDPDFSKYSISEEATALIKASARRYKGDEKTILQQRRANKALVRARKTLGTDK